jgi:hypothetical protein
LNFVCCFCSPLDISPIWGICPTTLYITCPGN